MPDENQMRKEKSIIIKCIMIWPIDFFFFLVVVSGLFSKYGGIHNQSTHVTSHRNRLIINDDRRREQNK